MTPPVIGTIRDDVVFDVEDPNDVLVGATDVPEGEVGVETGEVGVDIGVFVGVAAWAFTVTWKLPEPVLPASSVEEQFTVVVPRPKVEPDAGEQIAETDGSKLSVAEAE